MKKKMVLISRQMKKAYLLFVYRKHSTSDKNTQKQPHLIQSYKVIIMKAERAEEERNARDKFRADMIALEQQKV